MLEWRGSIVAAAAVLGACSPSPEDNAPPSPDHSSASAPAEEPAAEAPTADALPPPGATFRYVGRWAESVEQCRSEAWTFTRDRVAAPDDIACDFAQIEKSPGGYTIDAICTTGGEEAQDNNITLRFAESAEAMLVEGATSLPETGLIHCESGQSAAS